MRLPISYKIPRRIEAVLFISAGVGRENDHHSRIHPLPYRAGEEGQKNILNLIKQGYTAEQIEEMLASQTV
jgi:hypothetical protein